VQATRQGRSGENLLVGRTIHTPLVGVNPKMTVWIAKMTVRKPGTVVAVVEMVAAGAEMVSTGRNTPATEAEAEAEGTAAGRPVRGENPAVSEAHVSMFLVLTVLIPVCTGLESGNCGRPGAF